MNDLLEFLNQTKKYIETNNGDVPFGYQTNISFLSSYPYEKIKVSVPEWVRVDGIGAQMVGNQNGWKLLCIFNDIISPFELLDRDYLYLPSNFTLAIGWLRDKNRKQRRE